MLEIKGKVNTAICYAKVIEDEAIEQIRRMCDYEFTAGSQIRIMPNDTYLSFYLSTSRLHIFSKAIIEIGNPKFIRFLVKEDGQSMIMEAYHKKDFQSHRVPKRAEGKWEMEVRSLPLCSLIKNRLHWEDGKSYRIPGRTYPKQRLAVFDLTAAEQIQKLPNHKVQLLQRCD